MRRPEKVKTLLTVWVCLLVLLALTTGSSFLPLGVGNTLINGAIAIMKISLIALYFMHLRRADAAVRLAAGAALLFLFFLAFLSFADLLTRPVHPAPWQPPTPSQGTTRAGPSYPPLGTISMCTG
jgi:cytochrome c oxidase subunit 4